MAISSVSNAPPPLPQASAAATSSTGSKFLDAVEADCKCGDSWGGGKGGIGGDVSYFEPSQVKDPVAIDPFDF